MVVRSSLAPRYRADHVGSLLRPAELIALRADFDAGRCTQEQLSKVEDACILSVIKLQGDVGLKVITDGEFRR